METRAELVEYAEHLLLEARRWASPSHALITFPGKEGGFGSRVDGLEGFARTFLIVGLLLAGENGKDPHGFAQWYAQGITAGVDPESPDRWILGAEHPQAKVEAASIALVLDMTRPWIWDKLSVTAQQNMIDYLSPAVGDKLYPQNNWIWFRIVVETFLKSVGGPYSDTDIREDLDTHHSYIRAGGWFTDGPQRSYDHYVGWAMHLYPVLWSQMQGAKELVDPKRFQEYRSMLQEYLGDLVRMVGGDGAPLIQGRSLVYRFATAAPYWIGAYAGLDCPAPGLLRNCAMSIVNYFHDADPSDILTLGWRRPWRQMAQTYSGPGSPYWAAKGLLGLALPADNPVWTAPIEPLPSITEDSLFAIESPGWIVSSTKRDGIVRVFNHGTDHEDEGRPAADSPLYGRFGYSTITAPLTSEESWLKPLDMAVTLLDEQGRVSHRSGMTLLEARMDGEVGIGASAGQVHWIDGAVTQIGHGKGVEADLAFAGKLTVISLIREDYEVRLARFTEMSDLVRRARIGGWPLASDKPATKCTSEHAVRVKADGLLSSVSLATRCEGSTGGVIEGVADSMLAELSFVPYIEFGPQEGEWVGASIRLAGLPADPQAQCSVAVGERDDEISIRVVWPDGEQTEHLISPTDGQMGVENALVRAKGPVLMKPNTKRNES